MNGFGVKNWLSALAAGGCVLAASAAVTVDPVFSSNMVLQQQKPVAFFGRGDAGTTVTVEFAGKKAVAKVDSKGAWRVVFPAMTAGKKSYTAKISDGKNVVEFKDLLIGEVWFCSGQSNMQMPIQRTFRRGWAAANCEKEVAAANYPEIRYAFQKLVNSHNKIQPAAYTTFPGWVKCSPETAHAFSATAYFFGRRLYRDMNIPVGLINASWGGTRVEPWISRAGYAGIEPESALIKRFDFGLTDKKVYEIKLYADYRAAMQKFLPSLKSDLAKAENKFKNAGFERPEFNDAKWRAAYNGFRRNTVLVRDYRAVVTLTPEQLKTPMSLQMPYAADAVEFFVNGTKVCGWEPGAPDKARKLKPALKLVAGKNVLALRTVQLYPETARIVNWQMRALKIKAGKNAIAPAWKQADALVLDCAKLSQPLPAYPRIPYASVQFPCNLYNGMVDAWTKLPVRGVIWYQGCSNNGQKHYYQLHKALISDWRARWNQPDMPFIIVQLAGYEPARKNTWASSDPTNVSGYALTRDIQQRMMLELKNVGLATAIDIGEASNIHPANKQDLGNRLALEAERIAYGRKVVSRGPLFQSAKAEGGKIRVAFLNTDGGLTTSDGKAPGAFAVAGADKKFYWATAKIDGATVVVSAPQVKEPKFVRYAYAGFRGDCNLRNGAGLPAYPFTSLPNDYK